MLQQERQVDVASWREPNIGQMQCNQLFWIKWHKLLKQVNLPWCKKMSSKKATWVHLLWSKQPPHWSLFFFFFFYLHGFPLGHKLHGKKVKPKKPVEHNIHTNTVEPTKGTTIRWPRLPLRNMINPWLFFKRRMVIINIFQIPHV